MPKTDLLRFECEYCGNSDTFDLSDPSDKKPMVRHWSRVMDLDDDPRPDTSYRWYDCLECMMAGEKRHRDAKNDEINRQKALDEKLAKANEAIRKSGFMDKAVEIAKA